MVDELATNPLSRHVFVSFGTKPQAPVQKQVAVFLMHHSRPRCHTLGATFMLNVGHGSTSNYRERVTRAIRLQRDVYIKWPSRERKAELSLKHGPIFGSCVGAVDGSILEFAEKPSVHRIFYYSGRKGIYGVSSSMILF